MDICDWCGSAIEHGHSGACPTVEIARLRDENKAAWDSAEYNAERARRAEAEASAWMGVVYTAVDLARAGHSEAVYQYLDRYQEHVDAAKKEMGYEPA